MIFSYTSRFMKRRTRNASYIRKGLIRRAKNRDINFELGITHNPTFARRNGRIIYMDKMRSWAPSGAFQKTDDTHLRARHKSYSMAASALWFKNRVRSSRFVTSLLDQGLEHGAAHYLMCSIVNNAERLNERTKEDIKSHAP